MEFSQIALLLSVAAVSGIVAKLFKQPLLIGYLFAGFLLSAFGLTGDHIGLESMGQIGVALLLFLVGIEMNISELPSIGKVALFTGLGQILFTSSIGLLLSMLLGFPLLTSVYIAIGLTFSSTIIIVKLLGEKNDLESLYGKISVGFLLVQDFVAVILLMFLASLGSGGSTGMEYFLIGIKAAALFGVVWLLSKHVFPKFFSSFIDSSTELVFIVSIGWALGFSAFVGGPLGFSIEIGGFLAGLALSSLPEHLQVATRTRPLRDFFLTIFFLILGTSIVISNVGEILLPALVFSLFVLIGNPLIVLTIMGLMGYKKRTSFLSSVTVAQISEFSLILMAMGLTLGHVTETHVSMMVIVGAITMTASTYLILGTDSVYKKLEKFLAIFERKNPHELALTNAKKLKNHVVLIGSNRTGNRIRRYLERTKKAYVVIDFNPDVVKFLEEKGVNVVFGDISDEEVAKSASLSDADMVISTTSNLFDNLTLLERIKSIKKRPLVMLKAFSIEEAVKFYKKGASYVTVPEIVAGDHIRHLLHTYGYSNRIKKLGKNHYSRLKKV